jgi:hypothetical protein
MWLIVVVMGVTPSPPSQLLISIAATVSLKVDVMKERSAALA